MTISVDAEKRLAVETHDQLALEAARAKPSSVHLQALDGIRGVAIILVLLLHYGRSAIGFGYHNPALSATQFGWVGVDLFFVLSGFLITGILYDSKGSAHFFRNFYARRTLRIFPLYYTAFFFVLALSLAWPQSGVSGTSSPLYVAFYLTNVQIALSGPESVGIVAHFWSLAVEEHFYLMWPFAVFLLSRRALLWFSGSVLAGALFLRTLMTLEGGNAEAIYMLTPMRMDALAAGALFSLLIRGPGGIWAIARSAWVVMIAAGAMLATLILARQTVSETDPVMQTLGYTLFAAMSGGMIVVALTFRPLNAVMSLGVLRWFGRYSYGLYVWHPIVNVLLFYTSLRQTLSLGDVPLMLLAFVLVLATAYLSYNLWEKRFLHLKRYFHDHAPAQSAAG